MNSFKNKSWAFYLLLFVVFAIGYFIVSILIDHPGDLRRAISALVSGGVFTLLWWLIDKLSKAHGIDK